MRTLVTGASGFVGGALLARLVGGEGELFGLSRRPPREELLPRVTWRSVDLRDADAVQSFVGEARPDRVVHLAALAHPRDCERDPELARATQVDGTRGLFAALAPGTRVVLASTAQVYGSYAPSPIGEDAPARPETMYGRTKLEAEGVAREAVERGVEVIVARPFNHSGPGQSDAYVLPALAASVRRALAGDRVVRTGNLFPRRDFLHVDDVLGAYELLLERGEPGSVLNVCRGESTPIAEILEGYLRLAGERVEVVPDPERVRADDPEEIVGDPGRLVELGWSPRLSLATLLEEVWAASA